MFDTCHYCGQEYFRNGMCFLCYKDAYRDSIDYVMEITTLPDGRQKIIDWLVDKKTGEKEHIDTRYYLPDTNIQLNQKLDNLTDQIAGLVLEKDHGQVQALEQAFTKLVVSI